MIGGQYFLRKQLLYLLSVVMFFLQACTARPTSMTVTVQKERLLRVTDKVFAWMA